MRSSPLKSLPIHWPAMPDGVAALSTLRAGGVSDAPYDDGAGGGGLNLGMHVSDAPAAVARNRSLLRALLPAEPVWLNQVHGIQVIDAASALSEGVLPDADASVTRKAGVVCAILTADCMPVLLADRQSRVVGAAHAGWRGLAGGVIEATVERLRAEGGDELVAWLGPGIGPSCFEVGEDVPAAFSRLGPRALQAFTAIPDKPGKYLADLPQLARLALAGVGVTEVAGGDRCTVSEPQNFYSFRRDRITGRMATLIWIR